MNAEIKWNDKLYEVNLALPKSIGLEIKNGSTNPNCYYAEPVKIEAIKAGSFIGDIKEGGTVNHKKITLSPHGNGTHTECSGHIYDNGLTISKALTTFLHLAQVTSIEPRRINTGDQVISRLELEHINFEDGIKALVIRTLPNTSVKRTNNYSGTNPTYILPEAMQLIVDAGIEHLIVDLPSVDREEDGGKLAAHKTFWGSGNNNRINTTITELAYIEDNISDGIYLLNLQPLLIDLDASPSNPVLYSLSPI
jgi:kynurenine formamidase